MIYLDNMELEKQFSHITTLIKGAKQRAYQAVNNELVSLYWQVGEYVSQQVASKTWGKSVVQELANFIQKSEPNIIGFSSQNIWRMKQFYETYKENQKLYTLCREISWSHQRLIMACRTPEEREFYLRLNVKEKSGLTENWNDKLILPILSV
jgi:predicted nuclease of restriction endonuclease-like (RecB) superfamily